MRDRLAGAERWLRALPVWVAPLLTLLCASFVAFMSLIDGHELPGAPFEFADKVVHVGFYLGFSFVLGLSLRPRLAHAAFWAMILAFFYGFFLEFGQEQWASGRFFDMKDAVANGIGAFLASSLRTAMQNALDRSAGRSANR